MVTLHRESVDTHGYEEFGMSDILLFVTFGKLINENKKCFNLMEKMFHRLDPLLRSGNSQGAQMVLDTFLDGYEIEREGNYETIPEWLKVFIRLASKKIRDLNDFLEKNRQYSEENIRNTRTVIEGVFTPKIS